ncbi:Esterase EstB [Arthrobacter saudimassiliensis]|uniref:Esterase EstB n=1 Tax=Arthrobacter saudimassiliensis TaxID=1461584 RepID=A0A078MLM7_9MICC|nr:Esterase EstB [Arthrobacter saudimassiliensis]
MDVTARLQDLLDAAVADGYTASAVCAAAVDGEALPVVASGLALRFGADGRVLPPAGQVPATPQTRYDLASVTKPFSALALLALVRDGLLDLDEPVAARLPAFAAPGGTADPRRRAVTLQHLLTHTSGLPGTWTGWRQRWPGRPEALDSLLSVPLAAAPGTVFTYSCVGYNTAMALAEAATGSSWPDLVHRLVLEPLALTGQITFRPRPSDCAATECGTADGRPLVRGEVHDESAWAMGGAAANAGLFGTAAGVLRFAEALRGGVPRLLPAPLAGLFWDDGLDAVLGPASAAARSAAGYGQTLGLRIGQLGWMGRKATAARGHNGFTGTAFLTDRRHRISVVLLANRVHPSRTGPDFAPIRAMVNEAVYASS